MKSLLIFISSIFLIHSQSYIYEDEFALSPGIAVSTNEDFFTKSAFATITLFGKIDLSFGFIDGKRNSGSSSSYSSSYSTYEYSSAKLEYSAYALSYEFLSVRSHRLSIGLTLTSSGVVSSTTGLSLNYVNIDESKPLYLRFGLAYAKENSPNNTELFATRLGLGAKFELGPVNLLFEPGASVSFSRGKSIFNAHVGLVFSVPF